MKAELSNITYMVKNILEKMPQTRDSDDLLYCQVIEEVARILDINTYSFDIKWFFHDRATLGFPSFESVSRARRKLQATYPELTSTRRIEKARKELEKEFEAYAFEEV